MQIKYACTYPLVGISMICQDFYKWRILFVFCACLFFAQMWWGFYESAVRAGEQGETPLQNAKG